MTYSVPSSGEAMPVIICDVNGNPIPVPFSMVGAAPTGVHATAIAALKSTDTIIKASPGIFYGILITTVGAGVPTVFDNGAAGSGKIVGIAPASAVLGLVDNPDEGIECLNGITVGGNVLNPGMTIFWV
jgi:hypothetical protein